jgi:hypothetical protein
VRIPGYDPSRFWETSQGQDVLARLRIDHFETVAGGMSDEHTAGPWLKCTVVEGTVLSPGDFDYAGGFERHA